MFALEIGRLVARTRNLGDVEERLVEVIEEVKESDGEIILFIDDLHTLIGYDSCARSHDVANILKSALSRGDIKVGSACIKCLIYFRVFKVNFVFDYMV